MILKDNRGNELVKIIDIEENSAMAEYAPVTHCLAVVMVGNNYLLGWNKWRKDWEIFGGCISFSIIFQQNMEKNMAGYMG